MKLASYEAMRCEPPTSPPDPCEHKRARWRFGRVRCPDCGETWVPVVSDDEEEFTNNLDNQP